MSEQAISPQAQTASPAWIRIERARHPQRPYPMDFIEHIFTDFSEIHGDRVYGDDEAVACGMARLQDEEVLVIGNRKGGSTKDRVRRNFGMPHPEGYRKALRAMKIAEKFGRPVISFIDLPGAFPGLGAEERGQAEAIARNLLEMSRLRVPTISVISGEGGSGGALALAVADRVLILENALYFVITPESCAAIMWHDAAHKQLAAEAMRISAPDCATASRWPSMTLMLRGVSSATGLASTSATMPAIQNRARPSPTNSPQIMSRLSSAISIPV